MEKQFSVIILSLLMVSMLFSTCMAGMSKGSASVNGETQNSNPSSQALSSWNPLTNWEKTYGGTSDEQAYALVQTTDGGYALAGYTASSGAGSTDFWLVKTDVLGNMQWNKTYGGPSYEAAFGLVQTTDGGYALAGYTYSFGAGQADFWLVKTDASGNMQWNKTYGGTGYDYPNALVQTTDGGYALAGYTNSFGAGQYDFWLVKTDASGNMRWNQTYGGPSGEIAYALVQATDGGYALAGYTNSFGAGSADFWLVKTNASGTMQWSKTYGGTADDVARALVQTSDGGYAIAGGTHSLGAGSTDTWLVKTDVSGNMQWNKTYGGTNDDFATALVQTTDGGYALNCYTLSFGAGDIDFWLVKTDASGNMQGNQTYGGTSSDEPYALVQTTEGGYALAGSTYSFGAGSGDFWLVKVGGASGEAYYSVEPVAIPKLRDDNASLNGLTTDPRASPVGQSFTVEIHLRNATADNVPYGVTGVEVHFYFGNTLNYCVPTGFTTYLGQSGGALNGPVIGEMNGFYATDGTLVTDAPYTGAVYYKVAQASTGAAWNGADGLVATITFKITHRPLIETGSDTASAKMGLINDFTALGSSGNNGVGTEIPHGNVSGLLVVSNDRKTSPGRGGEYPIPERVPKPGNKGEKEGAPVFVTDDSDYTITFNVTAYANTTIVDSQNVTLLSNDSTIVELDWNTTDFAYGNYDITVSFFAYPVQNETIPENSTDDYGWVALTIPGDLNGDFKVSLADLVLLAQAYGSHPSDIKWYPDADIDSNGVVGLSDLVILAHHYGQHYP